MTTRPTTAELEEMKVLGAATLYECQGGGALSPQIRPLDPGMRLAGPALTVDVPAGDNLALHYAIARARPGDVLVADYKGYLDIAVAGDVMASCAKARGVAGLVVDGAMRDATEITAMDFPTFARGLSIRGPSKSLGGSIGLPVSCGGQTVKSGDIIVGDQDGVVAIDGTRWKEVLEKGRARAAKEAESKKAFAAGATSLERLGLTDVARKLIIDKYEAP